MKLKQEGSFFLSLSREHRASCVWGPHPFRALELSSRPIGRRGGACLDVGCVCLGSVG